MHFLKTITDSPDKHSMLGR